MPLDHGGFGEVLSPVTPKNKPKTKKKSKISSLGKWKSSFGHL